MRAKEFIVETAMMGKIADSGKIIRILKKAHTVPFSDEKNWLLVDTDPGKGNSGLGIKWISADTRFEWVRPYRDSIDENFNDDAAEEYRAHLIKTLPKMMKLFANIGKGWIPSKEQMLSAVDTAYTVMKHTGDAKQAGKVLMDELNTLYRMSQGQPGVAEEINSDVFNPAFNDTQIFDELTYRATAEKGYNDKTYFQVKVLDSNFQQVGLAKFSPTKRGLVSAMTWVHPEYQGQGLARNIYAYVRSLGNTIAPSRNQLPAGKAMWASWKKSGDAKYLMRDVAEGSLGTVLPWPEVVNKVNSAMKAMGWKGQRKADGSFMFSTKGQLDDEFYIVIIDNEGNSMFTYALGTVEEGTLHIGEQDTLPTTEASVSELMNAIQDGFGLNENFADGRNPEDKGDSKRHGINTRASVSSLRKTAKSGGRKGQLAHWLANMKSGRAKAKSKNETIEQGLKSLTESEPVTQDYMAGHCHVMAIALKMLHPDWQIRAHVGWDDDAADDTEYRVDHVYTVAPDGSAYDCRGRFDSEEALVGQDATGGVETQYADVDLQDIKQLVQRGELKRFTRQDIDSAMRFAKQIGQQGVAESDLDKYKKYIRPVVKTTPKIEKDNTPSGRTTDHIEWKVTSPTGEIHRYSSKKQAQAKFDSFGPKGVAEGREPDKKYTIKKSYTMSTAGVEKSVWYIMDGDFVVDATDLRRDAKYYADKWNAAEKDSKNISQNPPLEENLNVDVPNEEWLNDAIAYAKKNSPDRNGLPYMGNTTASARQVEVPVSILKRIPGMRHEQSNVRHHDLAAIKKIMHTTGKLPLHAHSQQEYKPFINVAYDGSAWVNEGNHRIMAAAELSWPSLPVNISYFDGGERVESGAMYPGKIGLA